MADGGLVMKSSLKKLGILLVLTMFSALLAGCGEKEPTEEWAYIHEPEVPVLSFYEDGKAVLHGKEYKYVLENDVLTLTDSDGNSQDMRFVPDGDKKLLYERAYYEYTGEGDPDGLIGYWQEINGNLSFEFTANGTFREDNISPGYYLVDTENGKIQLIYNDMYEDAFLYYSIDGRVLTVDYPWPVVPAEKE